VIAEPKALIRLCRSAGDRADRAAEAAPKAFQRAEFLLEKGAIDMIVDRRQLRDKLHGILSLLQGQPADNRGVTLLSDVVRTSTQFRHAQRLAKVRELAERLGRLEPDEIRVAIPS